ncbi:hypothetical protein BO82DRAFT_429681 [Aspergillus uvarum CBS 121591]|uniref:Uncharacterized protein n=1 Tax=Aspergillus uvarum CBS 121591 TaxID=1448315 RepID=A0A319E258_9EURO|nr:hypothetical protein BO82DRAFT_429681 [Aspergillus uvarum CBS 121591]PYH85192.1 hypothetical protein BO82DRAFT_429681 [Aspergillus uvarum CBS 121591]
MFFTRGGRGNTMGMWSIVQCSDKELYWFDGKAFTPDDFMTENNLHLWHEGYISTWARDHHFFQAESHSLEQIQEAIGSGNIWRFSSDDLEHYGTFLQNEGLLY